MDRPTQRAFDFQRRQNALLAQITALECADVNMSIGRLRCVQELLVRLAIVSKMTRQASVRATSAFLAAGIKGRRAVTDRTMRRWAEAAEELGLIERIVQSHAEGGRTPNLWVCHWSRLDQLTGVVPDHAGSTADQSTSANGRTWGGRGADTVSAPGADIMSAPLKATEGNIHPPTPHKGSAAAEIGADLAGIVGLVHTATGHAIRRGLTPDQVRHGIATARANANRFHDWRAALVSWLRTGDWPAEIRTLEAIEEARQRANSRRVTLARQRADQDATSEDATAAGILDDDGLARLSLRYPHLAEACRGRVLGTTGPT